LFFCRFSFGLYIVCSFVKTRKRQTKKRPKENEKRTNNIRAKGKPQKNKQYKGQRKTTKGQTI
jgi:hypothetical protein